MKSARWLLIPVLVFPLICFAENSEQITRQSEDATAVLEDLVASEKPAAPSKKHHAKKKKMKRKSRAKSGQVSTSEVPNKALSEENRKKSLLDHPTVEGFEMNPHRRTRPAIVK